VTGVDIVVDYRDFSQSAVRPVLGTNHHSPVLKNNSVFDPRAKPLKGRKIHEP